MSAKPWSSIITPQRRKKMVAHNMQAMLEKLKQDMERAKQADNSWSGQHARLTDQSKEP